MSLVWGAYRTLSAGLGTLAPHGGWLVSAQERASWNERLGDVHVPGGVHAWIHAASMGETLAAGALLGRLRDLQPGARFHLTATTRGGRARLRALDPTATLAPMDAPQMVARFFDGVRPARLFLIETELWPHWLLRARADGVPVAVVSARLSPRSTGRYRRFGRPLRDLLGGVAGVLCQSEADAERWRAIGAAPARTVVVGNLKNDALPPPAASRGVARAALDLDPVRPLLVLGSLRPGEPERLARAWLALTAELRERWQVVAVPRHPRASEELAAEVRGAGIALVTDGAPSHGAWRWDDRLGVLAPYYQAGEVAFVGGSLLPFGGHNPLEPAACGAAVLMGPHFRSQIPAVRILEAHGGLCVARDDAALAAALASLLGDPAVRDACAAGALAAAADARGAAGRAVRQLVAWDLWPAA